MQEEKEVTSVTEQDYDGNPLHDQVETDEEVGVDISTLFKGDLKQKPEKSPSPLTDYDLDGKC